MPTEVGARAAAARTRGRAEQTPIGVGPVPPEVGDQRAVPGPVRQGAARLRAAAVARARCDAVLTGATPHQMITTAKPLLGRGAPSEPSSSAWSLAVAPTNGVRSLVSLHYLESWCRPFERLEARAELVRFLGPSLASARFALRRPEWWGAVA